MAALNGEVFAPGDMCGAYEIVRLHGVGGFAEVYGAIGPDGQSRAVKVLRLTARSNQDLRERFHREIQLLSVIDHAHVVRFFEAGVLELQRSRETILWVALEFLEGKTLREILDETPRGIPVESVLRWGRQIAEGLAEAHRVRATHRDLKPENIAIATGDIAKVFDFGIAKFHAWGVKSTHEGRRLGTALYMAPEQIRDGKVDARSDIYALGLILYELSLGEHPFGLSDPNGKQPSLELICRRQLGEVPPPLATVLTSFPEDLSNIIDRALQKVPDRRFSTMREMADALIEVTRQRRGQSSGDLVLGTSPAPPKVRALTEPLPATFEARSPLPGRVPLASAPLRSSPPAATAWYLPWKRSAGLLVAGVILGAVVGLLAYEIRARLWVTPAPPSIQSSALPREI
jgi:serine/threonine protein kinase